MLHQLIKSDKSFKPEGKKSIYVQSQFWNSLTKIQQSQELGFLQSHCKYCSGCWQKLLCLWSNSLSESIKQVSIIIPNMGVKVQQSITCNKKLKKKFISSFIRTLWTEGLIYLWMIFVISSSLQAVLELQVNTIGSASILWILFSCFSEDWTSKGPDELVLLGIRRWNLIYTQDLHYFIPLSALKKKQKKKTSERAKAWPQSLQPGRYNPITLPKARLAFNASQYIILYILLSPSGAALWRGSSENNIPVSPPKLQIISTPTRRVIRTCELKQITCRLLHDQFINLRQWAWIWAQV